MSVNWNFELTNGFCRVCHYNHTTFFTISAFPSAQANFVSAFATGKMSKLIVTWPTKCRTRCVEIILRTLHTNTKQARRKKRINAIQCKIHNEIEKGHKITQIRVCAINNNTERKEKRWNKLTLIYTLPLEWKKKLLTDTLSAHFCQCNSMYSIRTMAESRPKTRLHQSIAPILQKKSDR